MGIWIWIVLFVIAGALMLWQGMKGNDNHSFLADTGRLLIVIAWFLFCANTLKSCVLDKL